MELIQDINDATVVRQLARVLPPLTSSDSLGAPTLTAKMNDAEWTSELGVPDTDSALRLGKRALTPHPLAKEVPVSKVLVRKVREAETLVRGELARVVSEAMENAYMTGDGVQKPLGVFTASEDGITTSRDVSTGNTASTPKFDGLKAAKYELKQPYWSRAQWVFHRDVMELIAKLKDGNGRYLLQDSVVQGEPDRMLGFPVRLSEFAPNTISASQYVGILGDFSNYWIVDSLAAQVQVARELYVRNNQDLYVIRAESDGAPVREEAFVRVKLGT
jgi:HK97 family phage major capsid protein